MSSPAQAAPSADALSRRPPQSQKAVTAGFSPLPNYVPDELLNRLTHGELMLAILVCRRTAGFADSKQPGQRVKEDSVTDEVWTRKTGLSARAKRLARSGLIAKEILQVDGYGNDALFSLVDRETFLKKIPPRIDAGNFPGPYTVGYDSLSPRPKVRPIPAPASVPVLAMDPFCLENGCERSLTSACQTLEAGKPEPTVSQMPPHREQRVSRAAGGPQTQTPIAPPPHEPSAEHLKRIREIGNKTLGVAMGGLAMRKGFEREVSAALPTASLDHLESLCKSKVESGYSIAPNAWGLMLLLCEDAEQDGAREAFEMERERAAGGKTTKPKTALQKYAEEKRRRQKK